jgi:hypothetical protein
MTVYEDVHDQANAYGYGNLLLMYRQRSPGKQLVYSTSYIEHSLEDKRI